MRTFSVYARLNYDQPKFDSNLDSKTLEQVIKNELERTGELLFTEIEVVEIDGGTDVE